MGCGEIAPGRCASRRRRLPAVRVGGTPQLFLACVLNWAVSVSQLTNAFAPVSLLAFPNFPRFGRAWNMLPIPKCLRVHLGLHRIRKSEEAHTSSWRVLRNPRFRLYFLGSVTSDLGTWLQNTAQVLLAYRFTHSVLAIGLGHLCAVHQPIGTRPVGGRNDRPVRRPTDPACYPGRRWPDLSRARRPRVRRCFPNPG